MATIWHPKNTVSLDRINKLNENTATGYLDIKITQIGDDFIQGTMPVSQKTIQPQGLLHGGAS